MIGRKFTCSSGNERKLSKLDRFLVNPSFFNSWPIARVWSDHCPIVLKSVSSNFGARPFQIFDSWFGKPGFEEEVVKALRGDPVQDGPPDVVLMRKLVALRVKLKAWRDDMLKRSSEETALALLDLEKIEVVMDERELTEEEEWILSERKKVLKEEAGRKCSDLKQRSRIRWAKEGDENSKFSHATNCRKASNFIHGLFVNATWVSKPSLVKKEVYRFYKDKFVEGCEERPRLNCPDVKRISDSDALYLEARFSREEIKSAVFECGDDRAPGLEGINFRFVKHFWHLLEEDFFKIIAVFFETSVINMGRGSSFIP
ncbi:uncharacterized protein LOC143532638 [Bidens hawaiensis]|uniref:uncharacterized protein LOC143532638 n=1 Tax=Bidens hawaiensis TaxID=980011 RepID=UPI00404A6F84